MVMQAGAEKWDDGDDGDDEGASVDARPAPRDGSSSSSASTSSRARASENVGPGLLPSAVVADVGAFLFGYHTAVCNAPLSAIASELGFADDDGVKGVVVSALVLGGALGGLTVGALSDKIGRKATLTWVSAPLVVGTLVSGAATSEIAPPALRGTLNGFRRLAYVFGCLAAFQIAAPLKTAGGEGWWRPLFFDAAAPAVVLAVGAYAFAQESPVWLLTQNDKNASRNSRRSLAILQNIRGRAAVAWQNSLQKAFESKSSDDGEIDADSSAAEELRPREKKREASLSSWSGLMSEERNRLPLSIGVTLCALAAFSGSNTVIFYASTLFSSVGINNPDILTWAVGVPNVVGGFVALALSDKTGRRPLLLASFGGMSACLGLLSIAAYLTPANELSSFCADPATGAIAEKLSQPLDDGLYAYQTLASAEICSDLGFASTTDLTPAQPEAAVALVTIPLYVLFFSLGAGPIPWLLYNEVFPTRIRARAVSVCTALNYLSNSIVGATFLPTVNAYGLSGSYGFYTLLCASGYLFVDRFVPETKGVPLEDVEALLRRNAAERACRENDA